MPRIKVSRDETTITRVTYEVDVPDDYKSYDTMDFDDMVTDKVVYLDHADEEVIDCIDTTAWKEVEE